MLEGDFHVSQVNDEETGEDLRPWTLFGSKGGAPHSQKKNENVKKKLDELYAKRKNIYNLANYKVDCDKLSINEIVKKIMTIYEYDKR